MLVVAVFLPKAAIAGCDGAQTAFDGAHEALVSIERLPRTSAPTVVAKKHRYVKAAAAELHRARIEQIDCEEAVTGLILSYNGIVLASWTPLALIDADLTSYQRTSDPECKTFMIAIAKQFVYQGFETQFMPIDNIRPEDAAKIVAMRNEMQTVLDRVAQRLGIAAPLTLGDATIAVKAAKRASEIAKIHANQSCLDRAI